MSTTFEMCYVAGTVRSDAYLRLLSALVSARREAGVSQAALAEKVGKPPSFIAKSELGERRLDVVEFLVLADALGSSLENLWRISGAELPKRL